LHQYRDIDLMFANEGSAILPMLRVEARCDTPTEPTIAFRGLKTFPVKFSDDGNRR
jgi:hypothetical protein